MGRKRKPSPAAAARPFRRNRYWLFLPILAIAVVGWMRIKGRVLPTRSPGIPGEPEYVARPKGTVVFSREIASILHIHCAPCHRAGQAAPFPLLSYDDARKHAAEIGEVTESGYMPPWLPVAGYGHFIDERRLTPGQKGLLLQWVREGAREGDPRETPAPPEWPGGWFLGKPDLVVTMPHPFPLTPEGADVYRNFVVPMNIDRDRHVRAVEFGRSINGLSTTPLSRCRPMVRGEAWTVTRCCRVSRGWRYRRRHRPGSSWHGNPERYPLPPRMASPGP